MKIDICSSCKIRNKIYAKGMCTRCYWRQYRSSISGKKAIKKYLSSYKGKLSVYRYNVKHRDAIRLRNKLYKINKRKKTFDEYIKNVVWGDKVEDKD